MLALALLLVCAMLANKRSAKNHLLSPFAGAISGWLLYLRFTTDDLKQRNSKMAELQEFKELSDGDQQICMGFVIFLMHYCFDAEVPSAPRRVRASVYHIRLQAVIFFRQSRLVLLNAFGRGSLLRYFFFIFLLIFTFSLMIMTLSFCASNHEHCYLNTLRYCPCRRIRCGWEGIEATDCRRLDCCFQRIKSKDIPNCFYKSVSPDTMQIGYKITDRRTDRLT